jgi:hypothetical protein
MKKETPSKRGTSKKPDTTSKKPDTTSSENPSTGIPAKKVDTVVGQETPTVVDSTALKSIYSFRRAFEAEGVAMVVKFDTDPNSVVKVEGNTLTIPGRYGLPKSNYTDSPLLVLKEEGNLIYRFSKEKPDLKEVPIKLNLNDREHQKIITIELKVSID